MLLLSDVPNLCQPHSVLSANLHKFMDQSKFPIIVPCTAHLQWLANAVASVKFHIVFQDLIFPRIYLVDCLLSRVILETFTFPFVMSLIKSCSFKSKACLTLDFESLVAILCKTCVSEKGITERKANSVHLVSCSMLI